jgi:hypothetical protein
MNEMTVIEINGVKMEVDLRQARRVDTLRVGDRVKVLIKGYSDYKVHAGTVIGFEPFEAMPTVIIAYLETSYSSVGVKFLYFNSQTKETEVIKSIDDDQLDIDKSGVLQQFDADIAKQEIALEDIKKKKDYFLQNFQSYWNGIGVSADATV